MADVPPIGWLYLFILALGPTTICFALYYYCMVGQRDRETERGEESEFFT